MNRLGINMFHTLLVPSDIHDFTVEQLQFIPKIVLLRVCVDYVDHVGQASRADPEVQLPIGGIRQNDSDIVNLNDTAGVGPVLRTG